MKNAFKNFSPSAVGEGSKSAALMHIFSTNSSGFWFCEGGPAVVLLVPNQPVGFLRVTCMRISMRGKICPIMLLLHKTKRLESNEALCSMSYQESHPYQAAAPEKAQYELAASQKKVRFCRVVLP